MNAQLSLPLLSKELAEQSARGRTFLLRTVYAIALYGVGLGSFVQQSGGWDNLSFNILGTGGTLFTAVVQYQLAAIYLLLPIMTAGTVTSEKERDTLGILLITKLDPWTIVLEKFLSRVVPMLLYILMSLPLLAVAYSLGGVENGQVLQAGVVLVLCVLQVGSLSVLCSVWFRTTAQAVIASYVFVGVTWILGRMPFAMVINEYQAQTQASPLDWPLGMTAWQSYVVPMFHPIAFLSLQPQGGLAGLGTVAAAASLSVMMYLTVARVALWPRAFLQAKSWGLILLKALDGFFHAINQNAITRGVVILRDHVPLPTGKPLAWRELNKRSLGTTRYLIRFLLLTEAPLIAVLLWPLATGEVYELATFTAGEWAIAGVWLLAVFMLLVQASALITGERARQTLDVLLSTPMMTRDIVMQKMAGVHYLIYILYVPMATAVVFWTFWLSSGQHHVFAEDAVWQVLRMIVQPLIYLPLVAWGGFYCGLKCKSQTQAMLLGCVLLAVPVGLPRVLLPMLAAPISDDGLAYMNGTWINGYGQVSQQRPVVNLLVYPIQLLLPCSNYLEDILLPDGPTPYYSRRFIPPQVRLVELLHWFLYGFAVLALRMRAPQALTRSTQRAEAPVETLALEPV